MSHGDGPARSTVVGENSDPPADGGFTQVTATLLGRSTADADDRDGTHLRVQEDRDYRRHEIVTDGVGPDTLRSGRSSAPAASSVSRPWRSRLARSPSVCPQSGADHSTWPWERPRPCPRLRGMSTDPRTGSETWRIEPRSAGSASNSGVCGVSTSCSAPTITNRGNPEVGPTTHRSTARRWRTPRNDTATSNTARPLTTRQRRRSQPGTDLRPPGG